MYKQPWQTLVRLEREQKPNRDDLIYKTDNKKRDERYDFQKFITIKPFGRKIYNEELTQDDVLEKQIKFKNEIGKSKKSMKPKTLTKKEKNHWLLKTHIHLLVEDKNILMALKVKYFQ